MKIFDSLKKIDKKKLIIAIALVVFGFLGRIFRIHFLPDLYNVEPITLVALLAGVFLGLGYALVVPLAVIALTDMYIGNSSILFFTWSAWAIIGLSGLILRKSKKNSLSFGLKMAGMGIVSSLFFYVWTNFGVWALSGMYSRTWEGLVKCYILALPFLKMNLLGNLVIIPVAAFTIVAAIKLRKLILMKKDARMRDSLAQ